MRSDPYPFIILDWVLPVLQEFFSSGRHQEEILFEGELIDPYFNRSYGIEYQHEGYNSRGDKIEKSFVSFSASLRNYNNTIDYPIGEFDFTLAEPFMKVDVYDNSPYRELLYSFAMHNIEIYGKRRLRKV